MKFVLILALAAVPALASATAQAQFVKGNEAVKVMPNGRKRVETPRLPATGQVAKVKPCVISAGCQAGPLHMVETQSGLKECTEPFAREGTCRDSTYGSEKVSRLWIAKRGSTWMWCQFPDLSSVCVDMNARPPLNLPTSAVQ
ncbi:hypothetical protein ACS5PN_27165 [Roseateles sp. NT4]|uniref:hypothetical protein n=1 Tax=Roseateles sp. NT4 TaxID=3453715 RepID=UPI003EEFABD8